MSRVLCTTIRGASTPAPFISMISIGLIAFRNQALSWLILDRISVFVLFKQKILRKFLAHLVCVKFVSLIYVINPFNVHGLSFFA